MNSPPPRPPKSTAPKRKAIIHESEEEKEEEERLLKRQSRDIPQPQPPSTPSLAGVRDQPLSSEPNEPAATNPVVQPSSIPTVETHLVIEDTSLPPQQPPFTSPVTSISIPDEELEEYFSAPITQPPSGTSLLV